MAEGGRRTHRGHQKGRRMRSSETSWRLCVLCVRKAVAETDGREAVECFYSSNGGGGGKCSSSNCSMGSSSKATTTSHHICSGGSSRAPMAEGKQLQRRGGAAGHSGCCCCCCCCSEDGGACGRERKTEVHLKAFCEGWDATKHPFPTRHSRPPGTVLLLFGLYKTVSDFSMRRFDTTPKFKKGPGVWKFGGPPSTEHNRRPVPNAAQIHHDARQHDDRGVNECDV